jgi:uncharacterized repeat protein (TIGR01451 family)
MNTFFSDCQFIEIGCNLYLDINFQNLAPNGSYSDGNKCYNVINGVVEFISNCPQPITPTPTPTPTPPVVSPTPTPTQTNQPPVPLIINWELSEDRFLTPEDFVDANMRIYVNEIEKVVSFGNNIGTINLFKGDQVRVQYFYLQNARVNQGLPAVSQFVTNPKIELLVNNSIIESKPITVNQDATYNYQFTINNNTDILVRSAYSSSNASANPKINLTKTANKLIYSSVGEIITYTFSIKNEGDVTLNNISIDDALVGLNWTTTKTLSSLAVGQTATFSATYTIKQTDINNFVLYNTATVKSYYNNVEYTDSSTTSLGYLSLPSCYLLTANYDNLTPMNALFFYRGCDTPDNDPTPSSISVSPNQPRYICSKSVPVLSLGSGTVTLMEDDSLCLNETIIFNWSHQSNNPTSNSFYESKLSIIYYEIGKSIPTVLEINKTISGHFIHNESGSITLNADLTKSILVQLNNNSGCPTTILGVSPNYPNNLPNNVSSKQITLNNLNSSIVYNIIAFTELLESCEGENTF